MLVAVVKVVAAVFNIHTTGRNTNDAYKRKSTERSNSLDEEKTATVSLRPLRRLLHPIPGPFFAQAAPSCLQAQLCTPCQLKHRN
jgi:hypothetical protein